MKSDTDSFKKGPRGERVAAVCPYCGIRIQVKTCLCAKCHVAWDMEPAVLRKIAAAKQRALQRTRKQTPS